MVSTFRIFFDTIIVVIILAFSVITGANKNEDLQKIRQNITDGLLSGEIGVSVGSDLKTAEEIIERIAVDEKGFYYFDDVDYTDTSRSGWKAQKHIGRTEKLTLLYRKETDEVKKEEYKKYILGLLDHWIDRDYQNSNWWYNKLSNPNALGEIGVLMYGEIDGSRKTGLCELVGRGCYTVNTSVRSHTGANAVDIAMSSIKFGVIADSRYAIKKAVSIVSNELEYSDDEGLRKDSTFFQHGERLYMGGYGIVYAQGITSLVALLDGTQFNFSTEKLSHLADFIVDGMSSVSYKGTLDPTTMGRSISRKGSQPLSGFCNTLKKLASSADFPRSDEIKAYISSIENKTATDNGVKWFDEAKFLVINNSDFYFSFRGGADYLAYSEIINDENVLAYNSSFPSVTTIMHTGNEYKDISPVFDYSLVPGTTAVYETDEQLFAHEDFTYRYLKGTYPEYSSSDAVIAGAKTTHEGINMTVTCFATDNAAFILGAGMTDSQGRAMNTAINQCIYDGEYERNGNTVIHGGIKYTLLDGGKLYVDAKHVTGSYHRNNLPYADEAVEGDVFALYFENKGSYAYSVMSEDTNQDIEIIVNSEDVQAVRLPDGRIAASFFRNTSFKYNGKAYRGKKGTADIFG